MLFWLNFLAPGAHYPTFNLLLLLLASLYVGFCAALYWRDAQPQQAQPSSTWINELLDQIPEGIFLLKGDSVPFTNPVAERLLADAGSARVRERVSDAVSQALPIPLVYTSAAGRKCHYLLQAYAVNLPFADRIVIAQDVTIAHEGQDARFNFIGTLSHEVKTPITSITMAIRLLQRGIEQIPNTVHRSLITNCVADVERLRLLLDDLLAVTRAELFAPGVDAQRVDLSKLLRHSAQNFRAQANERQIALNATQDARLKGKFISLDPTKVTWAISSLIEYALAQTPMGGKVDLWLSPAASIAGEPIEVAEPAETSNASSASSEDSVDWISLRVQHSGAAPDVAHGVAVFDKYRSGHHMLSERPTGLSFGLAVAQQIAASHGGRLWMEGSETVLSLPVRGVAAMKERTDVAQPGLVRQRDGAQSPAIPAQQSPGLSRPNP